MAGQTVTVSVLADTKKFSSAMKGLGKATGLNKLGAAAKQTGKVLAIGLGAGIAAAGLMTKKLIAAGEAAATSNSRIENISEQMGLFGDQAGKVSARLVDLANKTALSTGEDQNAIKAAQAKLLTFKEIAKSADTLGGIFDRTTQATIDLAAAGFGTAEDNAVQLGKALNDPVTGLSALTRSGITFTAAQKEMIKGMVEAGDTAGAQEMILAAIEQQVGGTAAATRNATDRIKVAWSVVQEYIGLKLLPILDKLTAWFLDKALPVIQKFGSELVDRTLPIVKRLGDWIKNEGVPRFKEFANWIKDNVIPRVAELANWITGTLVPGMVALVQWLIRNKDWLTAVAITIAVLVGAWKAYTTALAIWKAAVLVGTTVQAAFNAVMALNPIGLIIVAIAALVAGLVYFFTQTETGKKAWATFTDALVTGWEWIKKAFASGYAAVTGWLGKARDFIVKVWSFSPLGLIVTNWDRIKGAFSSGVSFVQDLLGRAKDAIVKVWSFSPLGLIVSNWDRIREFFTSIPARIRSALGNVGGTLRNAGKQLIDGFLGGITSKFNSVKSTLGNLTSKLTSWKGPPARDAKLLTDNGQLVLQSFIDGLESKFKTARRSLGGFTTSLAGSATTLAPKTSFAGMTGTAGGVVININTGVGDPVAIGREVSAALAAYERINGGRRA